MLFKHFIQEQEVAIRRCSFTWNPLKLSVKTLICNEIARWQPASLPKKLFPNGHIFVDSPSIRRRNSTWKVCENYIDFEKQIHVEIMTSIRRGNFDMDSTFKIDVISMSSPRRFFCVASTSNRHNFCTRCFHSIIF